MIEVYLLNLTDSLEEPAEKFLRYFPIKRQEKILSYKFTADRNRTIWAELLARSIVAKKMSRTIEEIQIERDPGGKPYLIDSALQISLAHSKNWAACSIGEVASGVDVEEDSIDELTLAENFFTPFDEIHYFRHKNFSLTVKKPKCTLELLISFGGDEENRTPVRK